MKSQKTKSLAKNSVFYLIYNVLNVLFPFITGVYVARVLLPDVIGQVAYAQNIASYFVILAFLGIPTYGLREVARARNNKEELNKVYSELVIINLISTCAFLSVYIALIFSVPEFRSNKFLYLITGSAIALNALNNSWLYEGLEEFTYISLRNVAFKIFSFVLLVLFVKGSDDYLIYAAITVIGTAGNYILNVLHARRFTHFTLKNLNFKRHLKFIFMLVVVNLAIEIYSLVDTTMLGIFSHDENVAFYSYGNKINKIFLQIINTFTIVLVPRISYCYKENNLDEFNRLLTNTLKIIIMFAVPMIIGIQFVSDYLVCKIYGNIYINSSYVLRILSVVMLISPIGYLLGSRVLLVVNQERKMIISVGVGAVVNIIGNLVLIPLLAEYGAAIASVISEIVVMIIYVGFGSKIFHLQKLWKFLLNIFVAAIILSTYLVMCALFIPIDWVKISVEIIGAVLIYGATLLILREPMILNVFKFVKKGNNKAMSEDKHKQDIRESELSLSEIHASTIEIIKKLAELCENIKVNYYVFYGSLIGVVRHQGFIPWDDDFDVVMMREDYDKFIKYCIENEEQIKPFKLLCTESEPNYPYAIARLNDMRYRAEYANMIEYESGMFIDIYPLDEVNVQKLANKQLQKKRIKQIKMLNLAVLEHFEPSHRGKMKTPFKFAAYLIAKLFGKNHYIRKINKTANKLRKSGSDCVAVCVWPESVPSRYYELKDFGEGTNARFENIEVKIPIGYERILKSIYGDFMKLPPENKRLPQHGYALYKRTEN